MDITCAHFEKLWEMNKCAQMSVQSVQALCTKTAHISAQFEHIWQQICALHVYFLSTLCTLQVHIEISQCVHFIIVVYYAIIIYHNFNIINFSKNHGIYNHVNDSEVSSE